MDELFSVSVLRRVVRRMFKERNRTCWEHGLGNNPGRLTGSWLAQRNKLIL